MPLLNHHRDDNFRHIQQAFHIGIYHHIIVVGVGFIHRIKPGRQSCVIHQDIDRFPVIRQVPQMLFYGRPVPHIKSQRQHLGLAFLMEVRCNLFQQGIPAAGNNYPVVFCSETVRGGFAYASRSSSDEDGFYHCQGFSIGDS